VDARRRLERFYSHCRDADVHELTRLARTVRRWQSQVLAWHATGLTNGPTEAVNLLVKKVKRVGHGFRNFDNYRLRLLLHCGVQWRGCCTNQTRGARDSSRGQAGSHDGVQLQDRGP
ncbi:MAG: transposase, partial [Actinobacteria bacterium]|nr:transposase [Actinomycetota bacterium]